jgi:hypothetical protein
MIASRTICKVSADRAGSNRSRRAGHGRQGRHAEVPEGARGDDSDALGRAPQEDSAAGGDARPGGRAVVRAGTVPGDPDGPTPDKGAPVGMPPGPRWHESPCKRACWFSLPNRHAASRSCATRGFRSWCEPPMFPKSAARRVAHRLCAASGGREGLRGADWQGEVILGADTTVVIDDQVLEKPRDATMPCACSRCCRAASTK